MNFEKFLYINTTGSFEKRPTLAGASRPHETTEGGNGLITVTVLEEFVVKNA